VTTAKIAANAVTSAKIPSGAVDTSELANLAVTAAKIAAAAVETTKIANDAVTPAKIPNRTRHVFFDGNYMGISGGATRTVTGTDVQLNYISLPSTGTSLATGAFVIPADWVSGNVTVKIWWSSSATSGDVRFNLRTLARASGEAINASPEVDTELTVSAPGGSNEIQVTTLSSAVPVSAGDMLMLNVRRLGDHAEDTMSASVQLFNVEIEYTADS
jgi:hypothetical protein